VTIPAHRATTANLGATYPFVAEAPLASGGPYIGRDLFGGSFCFDPFDLYASGVLTNPNMLVVGQIGRGKSAFVKTFLWRHSLFGRRAFVVDPKGEYGALAQAWGCEPLSLRPGGRLRLNPLEGTSRIDRDDPDASKRRRATLLYSLAEACLNRPLLPAERAAVDVALGTASARSHDRPLLTQVVEALMSPEPSGAREVGSDVAGLTADGRDVALELRRLVTGDLKGMFDGPTTRGLRVDGRLVVLDLSAVYGSAALGVIMACATAWMQGAVTANAAGRQILVVDEAWAILSHLATARWLQASWKLSRALGVANLAVLHRLSDLSATGATGSEQVHLAEGLLADSETRVVYAQAPGEAEACRRSLGLTGVEADLLPRLRRGVALWKVGRRSFVVEHRLSALEAELVNTDARMMG
jgi:hypothetical protein